MNVDSATQAGGGMLLIGGRPDPWLSTVLQCPALRIDLQAERHDHKALLKRLRSERLFATAKVPAQDVVALAKLQDMGFRVIDTALAFECHQLERKPGPYVRLTRPEDRTPIITIAGKAFVYSRFHLDPQIPTTIANRVKAAWADNYFEGMRGDGMVTVEKNGAIAGFLLFIRDTKGTITIDLIAVDPAFARQGLARDLIAFMARAYTPPSLIVGTQAANIPSINLYESLGFRLRSAQYVLHHHGSGLPIDEGTRRVQT